MDLLSARRESLPAFQKQLFTASTLENTEANADCILSATYKNGLIIEREDIANGKATTRVFDNYGNLTKQTKTTQTDEGNVISVVNYTYNILGD